MKDDIGAGLRAEDLILWYVKLYTYLLIRRLRSKSCSSLCYLLFKDTV
jgi:hypothetical protein